MTSSPANSATPPALRDQPGGKDNEDRENSDDDDNAREEDLDDGGSNPDSDEFVLHPDHSLMKRFQAALKSHLQRQDNVLVLELRELEETLKTRISEREKVGIELYGVQQKLAQYQMLLERIHDEYTQKNQQRQRGEEQLAKVRSQYKAVLQNFQKESTTRSQLKEEVDNLALRVYYVETAKEDVRNDIAVMRRAAEKVETEVSKAEVEKQIQDLYVDRLVEGLDKLKGQMTMYEAQTLAQREESHVANQAVTEALMEMEAIYLEKKQLHQQWSSSLTGMRHRNEAYVALQKAFQQQEEQLLTLNMEMAGYRTSIQKAQEQHEKLTMNLNKAERDTETVKKQLMQCHARSDDLKAEYATYNRILCETEQTLTRANTEKVLKERDLTSLSKQTQQEYQLNSALDDRILDRLQAGFTFDKTTHNSKKHLRRIRDVIRALETQLADEENLIARSILDTVNSRARIEHLDSTHKKQIAEVEKKSKMINMYETEIQNRYSIIRRQQIHIDKDNKKLESMIHAAGGVEVGPMEQKITMLTGTLNKRKKDIEDTQEKWLQHQSELVLLIHSKEERSAEVNKLKRELTVISQKKIRIEYEIEGQRWEIHDIERAYGGIGKDVDRLNSLIYGQKMKKTDLQETNIFTEQGFIAQLKECERDAIELSAKIDTAIKDKDRMLNELVVIERQSMLWERKEVLTHEARSALKLITQEDIKSMKTEIHRMHVRLGELMKLQEKKIQEMEKIVTRREAIVTRGYAQSKLNKTLVTKGTVNRQMLDLRRKIKVMLKDIDQYDEKIRHLQEDKTKLNGVLQEKQVSHQALRQSAESLDCDTERLLETKHKNLTKLVQKQQRSKHYQQAKEGRYTMVSRLEQSDMERNKQQECTQSLADIVTILNQQFPHCSCALYRVTLSLSSRDTET